MSNRKPKKLNKLYIFLAIIALSLSIVISLAPQLDLPVPTWNDLFKALGIEVQADEASFSLHVIDVGQGDCILVKCNDKAMLVDAGSRGNDAKILSYLEKQGVEKLDYVVATHPHEDHIGSLDKVIAGMDVGEIIMPRMPEGATPTTRTYESLLDEIEKKNMQITAARVGESFYLGDALVRILAPVREYGSDYNNMSVVLYIEFGESSFLLMGDAEDKSEKDIMGTFDDISADVIKIGHHGSKTSSTQDFLAAVNPRYALISVGLNNKYEHPDEGVLERLRDKNIQYFRTDLKGTIVVSSDGEKITVKIEK